MLKKTFFVLLFIPTTALLFSFNKTTKQQVLKTIIIDAGHGMMPNGGHNGAKGKYSYEDDICLAVSKKLVELISKDFPEVKQLIYFKLSEQSFQISFNSNSSNGDSSRGAA